MRLILAGSETGAALPAALAARHTVGGLARTPADLAGLWRRERPEAVVLVDAAAPPEAWVAVVRELLIPAVVVTPAHWDVTPWRGLAAQGVQVYAAGTPWATVWAALPAGETTPGAAAAETGPAPAAPAVSAAPPPPAPAPVGVPAVSATLAGAGVVLYPVVGGVGSSTLAVTLAATVAALGVKTLLATGDPWFLAGHWQFPLASRDEARAMSAALTGWVGGTGPAPVSADTLVVGDAWRGSVPVGLGALPVVLVARATSAAAWAAVAAGGELRRAGRALLGGGLSHPGGGRGGRISATDGGARAGPGVDGVTV